VIAITAASAGHGGGAATGGGKSTYYEANMAAEVYSGVRRNETRKKKERRI
jgi:hypothetical protein